MKKTTHFAYVLLLVFLSLAYFQCNVPTDKGDGKKEKREKQDGNKKSSKSLIIKKIEDGYPTIPNQSDKQIIKHYAFHLLYNEKYRQADWVAYILTKNMVESKDFDRKNEEFTADPKVDNAVVTKDYSRSGYDRGHLAPAADMSWSQESITECFYMSNMSPQTAGLNRGVWKELEENVRRWAERYDSLYIVTGPVLKAKDIKKFIGKNSDIGVPRYYYKAILSLSKKQAAGFILENLEDTKGVEYKAITIDELEKLTGIDFFANFNKNVIEPIESKVDESFWSK